MDNPNFQCPSPDPINPILEQDVVIVGGGISGLYCAMKLMQYKEEEPNNYKTLKSISILEKTNRWGGRLDTDKIKIGDDIVKEEEGGMRFTYNFSDYKKSNMPLLGQLIHDLGLEDLLTRFYTKPQANPPDPKKEVNNINGRYYNGQFFTAWYAEQNPCVWRNLYNLDENDVRPDPEDYFRHIYEGILDHNARKIREHFKDEPEKAEVILKQAPRELLQEYQNAEYWSFARNELTWPVDGEEITLNQFSMVALMREMGISHQACKMMKQTLPFVKSLDGNAGCVLQEFNTFTILSDDFYQFKEGYHTLIEKVIDALDELSSRNQVQLSRRTNCEVFSLRQSETKSNCAGFEIDVRDQKTNEQQTIDTQHVVLAVAPIAVEDILHHSKYSEFDNSDIIKICESTKGYHLTKINLYFKDDWWNKQKNIIKYWVNKTNLQIGTTYPFYAGPVDVPSNDHPCPAALTSYSELDEADFWSTLQRLGHKFDSSLQREHPKLQPVSKPLLKEFTDQLKKVFNTKEIPEVLLTSYRSWDGKKYQYGVHLWGLGVDDREMMRKAAKPIGNKNLYLCNEAWSGYQGWVEGALISTENVLQRLQAQLKTQHEPEE